MCDSVAEAFRDELISARSLYKYRVWVDVVLIFCVVVLTQLASLVRVVLHP